MNGEEGRQVMGEARGNEVGCEDNAKEAADEFVDEEE